METVLNCNLYIVKAAIEATIQQIGGMESTVGRFLDRLFEENPDLSNSIQDECRRHRQHLARGAIMTVGNLNNVNMLTNYLMDYGENLQKYGMTEERIRPIGNTIIQVVREVLGNNENWNKIESELAMFWRFIAEGLLAGFMPEPPMAA